MCPLCVMLSCINRCCSSREAHHVLVVGMLIQAMTDTLAWHLIGLAC